jgi:septal ring-binding cell division protein DamX
MAHQIPAHYDEEDCLFIPPSRSLGFNPQLKLNDSLLAQSYIEAYDISYPEAMRRIEAEVEEIKESLHNDGTYTLNDLGTLTVNADGNYEFTPCEAGILSPSLYGLGATSIQKLADKRLMPDYDAQAALTVQLADNGSTMSAPVDSDIEDTADNQETAAESEAELIEFEDDSHAVQLKMSWIRNGVAAVAAAILFFFIATPVVNSNLESATMANIGNKVLYKLFPQDTNYMPATPVANDEAPIAKAESPAAKDMEPAVKAEKPATPAAKAEKPATSASYTIVLASQVKKSNAESFVEQLHKDGIKDAHLFIYNNIVRVVCGSYATEQEAYHALQSIIRVDGLEDAWVYKMQS